MARNCHRTRNKRSQRSRRQVIRIDVLPDDVLLEIFDSHVIVNSRYIEAWQLLVHVCRRWRNLVFESPRRLKLQLCCTPKTPGKTQWTFGRPLPLIVSGNIYKDNVIAALEQSNIYRVCQVELVIAVGGKLEEVLAPMQVPFPELTDLRLWSHHETAPVIPDSFLGGSAPRLQSFELFGIPFPGLPKLLLSANHLVELWLSNIPHSGYISPEAMVAPLSVLSSLRIRMLSLGFHQSRTDWESRSLPPPKRSILPVLHELHFKGVTEYLEELVTRIDAPQLVEMDIIFLNETNFDCARLAQFINCTLILREPDEVHVQFHDCTASIALRYWSSDSEFRINIPCGEARQKLPGVAQVCDSFPPLSMVGNLYIEHQYMHQFRELVWENDAVENTVPFGWNSYFHLPQPRNALFLPTQRICARYRGRPARSRWEQNNRSVAHPAGYFRGRARAMGTFPGKH